MAGPVISTGPTGSSRYALPNYAPITQGYAMLGRGIESFFDRKRQDEEKEKQRANMAAIFGAENPLEEATQRGMGADQNVLNALLARKKLSQGDQPALPQSRIGKLQFDHANAVKMFGADSPQAKAYEARLSQITNPETSAKDNRTPEQKMFDRFKLNNPDFKGNILDFQREIASAKAPPRKVQTFQLKDGTFQTAVMGSDEYYDLAKKGVPVTARIQAASGGELGLSGKPLSGEQQRTTRAAVGGQRGIDLLSQKTKDGKMLFETLSSAESMVPSWVPGRGYVQSDEYLMAEAEFQNLLAEAIYLKSGAQAGQDEIEAQSTIYKPNPGDGPEVIASKFKKLQDFVKDARVAAGKAIERYNKAEQENPSAGTPALPAGGGGVAEAVRDATQWASGLFGSDTPTGNVIPGDKVEQVGLFRPSEGLSGLPNIPAPAAPPAQEAPAAPSVDPAYMGGVGTVSGGQAPPAPAPPQTAGFDPAMATPDRFSRMSLDQLKAIPPEDIGKMSPEELDALEAAYMALAGARG